MKKFALAALATLALYAAHQLPTWGRCQRDAVLERQASARQAVATHTCPRAEAAFDALDSSLR